MSDSFHSEFYLFTLLSKRFHGTRKSWVSTITSSIQDKTWTDIGRLKCKEQFWDPFTITTFRAENTIEFLTFKHISSVPRHKLRVSFSCNTKDLQSEDWVIPDFLRSINSASKMPLSKYQCSPRIEARRHFGLWSRPLKNQLKLPFYSVWTFSLVKNTPKKVQLHNECFNKRQPQRTQPKSPQ